jgi:hypothetical protein
VYANPPAYSYVCDPQYCVVAPDFTNVTWLSDETSYYPPQQDYYNLNPLAFGLDYGIFAEQTYATTEVSSGTTIVSTITTGDWSSQASLTQFAGGYASTTTVTASPLSTSSAMWKIRDLLPWNAEKRELAKRDSSITPAVCYASCNNCYIEGQKVGLQAALCTDSAFESDYAACEACIDAHSGNIKITPAAYLQEEFGPFLSFCAPVAAASEVQGSTTSILTVTVEPIAQASTTNVVVLATASVQGTSTSTPPVVTVVTTSQQAANTNTAPASPSPSTSSSTSVPPSPSPSTTPSTSLPTSTSLASSTIPSNGTATQSGPIQITGGSGASSARPVSFALMVCVALFSIFMLFL